MHSENTKHQKKGKKCPLLAIVGHCVYSEKRTMLTYIFSIVFGSMYVQSFLNYFDRVFSLVFVWQYSDQGEMLSISIFSVAFYITGN